MRSEETKRLRVVSADSVKTRKFEKCGAVYESSICQKKSGHRDKKHFDGSGAQWVAWTDLGVARVQREAEARLQREAKQ